nr:hypothetical protein [Tanacetum cinerariifolium]
MQQPMKNPKDISDLTTVIDMALVLMAKTFTLNDTTPTNNNQISSSNPSNMRIAKLGMNIDQDRQMLMVEDNVGNQFRPNAVQIANQYSIRNVVTARAEDNGNGINGNQIRCYNCHGEGHHASNYTVKPGKRDVAYLQKQMQITQKEEAGIQLTQEKFDFMADAEAFKFVRDFKSLAKEAVESIVKQKVLELEIERLLRAVVSQDIMFVVQNNSVVDTSNLQTKLERTKESFENCIIKKENECAKLWNDWYKKCEECKYDKISYDKAYNDMQQKIKRLQAQLGDLKGTSKDTLVVSDTLDHLS